MLLVRNLLVFIIQIHLFQFILYSQQYPPDSSGTLTSEPEQSKLSAKDIIKKALVYKTSQRSRLKSYDLHIFSASSIKYHLIDDPAQLILDYNGNDYKILGVSEIERYDYYKRDDGEYDKKTIITAKRQSELLKRLYAYPYTINFYDDEITMLNTSIPSPLADDCFDNYSYKLVGVDSSSGKKVYAIRVRDQIDYLPGFRGTIHIQDSSFALLDANLSTNYAINIPLVKNIDIMADYSKFNDSLGSQYSIPGNVYINVNASYVGALKLKMQIQSEIRDVKLNGKQKGIEYDEFDVEVKHGADKKPANYWKENGLIANDTAASNELKKIYNKKLEKKSYVSFTGSGLKFGDNLTWNMIYLYTFNRIEGNHLELNLAYERDYGRFQLNPIFIYGTADERFKYFINTSYLPTRNLDLKFSADVYSKVMPLFKKLSWINYYENAVSTLFTRKDRTDYFYGEGFKFRIDYRIARQITIGTEFHQERQTSVSNNTNFSFVRKNENYSVNIPVNDGMLRKISFGLIFDFNRYRMIDWGDGDVSRSSVTALPVLEFKYGYSGKKGVSSDFEFKDYSIRVTGNVKLLRMLKLIYKFGAYLKYGKVPYQELTALDPKFIGFPNDIGFTVPNYIEFLGDRVVFLNLENEFGKIFPYDIPILSSITLLGDIGFGKTWITQSNRDFATNKAFKTTDGIYIEMGFGLTRLLELGTLRYAWRLNNFNEGSDSFISFDIGLRL